MLVQLCKDRRRNHVINKEEMRFLGAKHSITTYYHIKECVPSETLSKHMRHKHGFILFRDNVA